MKFQPTESALATATTGGTVNSNKNDSGGGGGGEGKTEKTTADVSLSHTIDDDITFERVRHMPRRTQFVSTHRKLSWQYDKQVKQHERDQKLSHVELARAHTAMVEKLSRLQDAKKEAEKRKGDPSTSGDRWSSAPSLPDASRGEQRDPTKVPSTGMKHSHSVSSFPDVSTIPENEEAGHHARKVMAARTAPVGRSGRRATIAEGVTERTSLPPDLVRRLSQFMDSTSALLLTTRTGSSGRKESLNKTTDRFAEVERLPEQPEPEAEAV